MKKNTGKKERNIVLLVLSLAAFILAFLLSTRLWFRADLTKNKSWTISRVSKNLGQEIPDRVQITYFVTDKLKKLYPFPDEISDLLEEYVSFSHGKITFSEKDPQKENLTVKMQELGFPSQEIQVMDKDEVSLSAVYSGILIEYENRYETLPFVWRLDTLEYDITNRIRALVREKDKIAGIIIGEPEKTLEREYGLLQQYLSQAGYKTQPLTLDDVIPEVLSELFVLGGSSYIEDWTLYQIDRYIQTGGKVYFAVNSVEISASYDVSAKPVSDKGLLAMLEHYGVKTETALVLDASALRIQVPQDMGGFRVTQLVPYPLYIHVQRENGNADHPITARFAGADLYWANPLTLIITEGLDAAPLFTTTENGWLQTKDFAVNPNMALTGQLSSEYEATKGKHTLAAAISGKFPSFYRDKPKPEREGSDPLPDMPDAAAQSRIIVVGNAGSVYDFNMGNIDFFANRFAQEQPNMEFIVQAADWLGNDDDIISIRNRAQITGQLDKIADPDSRRAAFALSRIVSMVLMPLVLVILAVVFFYKRGKKTK